MIPGGLPWEQVVIPPSAPTTDGMDIELNLEIAEPSAAEIIEESKNHEIEYVQDMESDWDEYQFDPWPWRPDFKIWPG